ncbi:RES family NAD+ phosphorylase [Myxococcota bacterium]|nr:RES family NAD+ phosphorylase [Myxococcota bacterium]
MIKLFRIAKTDFITDLSGTGARLYGGRWNQVGYPLVYTSPSRALAALEFLVHVPMALAPDNLSIAELHIPAKIRHRTIEENKLPPKWRDNPAPDEVANLGTEWIKSKSTLLLHVPSAVVDKEINILINPLHPDFHLVKLASVERFSFDSRLLPRVH